MVKRIFLIAAVATALLIPKIASAQSSAETVEDEHGIQLIDTESQSVYLSRIYRENDVVEFWMQTSSGSFDTERHVAYVASCSVPIASIAGGYTYNYSMEQVQDRWVASDTTPEPVQPGTILQFAIEEACNF
ncbi:hypothetical protein H6F95_27710 [Cyanobacteria bacterium FACHB-471]|nr:hypothetical protein [Cyanobacteria bacterium FACHB-471]